MDYKSLLSLAEKNQDIRENEFLVKRKAHSGQTSGPNKSAIDAFKARKLKEELEKARERQKEKDRLLSLRAQSSKSVKRANMMKTRTKDNDFSRIVLTRDQIEEQRRVEEKLRRKGTQDLQQNRLSINALEENVIKNGNKNLKNSLKSDKNKPNNENGVKTQTQKPKPKPKPALSYDQLLSLAAEKAKSEKKSLDEEFMTEVEEKKQLRPMTQKEKDKLREELYYKQRAHKGLAKLPSAEQIKRNHTNERNVKRDDNCLKKVNNFESNRNNNRNNKLIQKSVSNISINHKINDNFNQNQLKSDKTVNNSHNISNQRSADRSPYETNERSRVNPNISKRPEPRSSGQSMGSGTNKMAIIRKTENRLVSRDKELNEKFMANKQRVKPNIDNRVVNRNINDRARHPSPPPPPMRKPMPKLPPIGSTYRRGMYEDVAQYVDDDYESEEDDDMADFIDDGPEEKPIEEDYSRAIREIFGYDKRKYRNIEDEDIEESNFTEIMKEDARSAKIGLLEDLEEERKEEEERRRYYALKKRQKK